jgi:hypothetical protein
VRRIEALRAKPATASSAYGELQPRRCPPRIKKHGGRQLAFKFQRSEEGGREDTQKIRIMINGAQDLKND